MEPLQRAALCVTDRSLLASGYRASGEPHTISFVPRGEATPSRYASGGRGPDLTVNIRYRLIDRAPAARREWRVEPMGYMYVILDRDGHEILAYHLSLIHI